MSVLIVIPGPGFPRFGSLLETIAKRSPFGSQEKSVTVSKNLLSGMQHEVRFSLTFQLHYFNWKVLLTYSEDFKTAEYRFLGFRVTVHFNTQKVTLVLPMQFALVKALWFSWEFDSIEAL